MPRPESERTLVLRGLDDVTANRAMTAALGSPFDVSGAAHVPNSAFRERRRGLGDFGSPRKAVTLLRLEGITASAAHRAGSLAKALSPFGTAEIFEDVASAAAWSSFASGAVRGRGRAWRLAGVAHRLSAGLGRRARAAPGARNRWRVIYDWGGGLIWAALPPKSDAQAELVRGAAGRRRARHVAARLRTGEA